MRALFSRSLSLLRVAAESALVPLLSAGEGVDMAGCLQCGKGKGKVAVMCRRNIYETACTRIRRLPCEGPL